MLHTVRIIEDDDLPQEIPWAFIRQPDCLVFTIKQSAARDAEALAAHLEDAWSAYRLIEDDELLTWPEPVAVA